MSRNINSFLLFFCWTAGALYICLVSLFCFLKDYFSIEYFCSDFQHFQFNYEFLPKTKNNIKILCTKCTRNCYISCRFLSFRLPKSLSTNKNINFNFSHIFFCFLFVLFALYLLHINLLVFLDMKQVQ